jgi:hypothetical protein
MHGMHLRRSTLDDEGARHGMHLRCPPEDKDARHPPTSSQPLTLLGTHEATFRVDLGGSYQRGRRLKSLHFIAST